MSQIDLEDRAHLARYAWKHERAVYRSAVLAAVYATIGVGLVTVTFGWMGLATAVTPAAIVLFGVLPARKTTCERHEDYQKAKADLARAEQEQWERIASRLTVHGRFEANGAWKPGDAA